ncbi:MAG: 6-bladed beta-propeller [bacterium]
MIILLFKFHKHIFLYITLFLLLGTNISMGQQLKKKNIQIDPALIVETSQKKNKKRAECKKGISTKDNPLAVFYELSLSIDNGWGSCERCFKEPISIAIDSNENIYVLDSGSSNNRIQKFNKYGDFVKLWGEKGTTIGKFDNPQGLAIDVNNDNVLYVVDTDNDRVQVFDTDGNCKKKSRDEYIVWGSRGSSASSFQKPTKICIDKNNSIYLLDVGNHRIQKFNSDGDFLTEWGMYGSSEGEFSELVSIAYNSIKFGDTIYILDKIKIDKEEFRLQAFDKNGKFLKRIYFQLSKELEKKFVNPIDFTFDNEGNIFVLDQKSSKIFKFRGDDEIENEKHIIRYITSWGEKGQDKNQLQEPAAIIAYEDDIFVVDKGNHRIQKFSEVY